MTLALATAGTAIEFIKVSAMEKLGIVAPFAHLSSAGGAEAFFNVVFGLALAAITEELVFRGLWLKLLEPVASSRLLLTVSSSLVFAVTHWSDGWIAILASAAIGVIFFVAYLRMRSIWVCIAAHYLVGFPAFGLG